MVGSHTDVTAVPGSERPQGPCLLSHDDPADEVAPLPTLGLPGSLLLVGYEASARARLGRALAAKGFAVTSVDSAETALVDLPPESGGVRSERHAALSMAIPSMPALASAGVR